jgi:cytochrome b561
MHWLSALLIVILIACAANTVDTAAKAAILWVHVPLAIAVLALTVVRIGWWGGFDRKPNPIAGAPYSQERTAQAVHLLFYVVVL